MLKNFLTEKIRLNKYDRKIADARSEGLSFCEMADDEIAWSVDQILVRGVALYGSTVPDSDFLAKFFVEEVSSFIIEFGYGELTLKEILLAMKMNCKQDVKYPSGKEIEPIPFHGVYFHVQFLASILNNYMEMRNMLDRKIQNSIDGYE